MPAPIVVPLAIAAGTAIAQWMNSEKGRAASAAEREDMKRLLSQIQSPQFDPSTLTPEQYKVARKYVPQAASFIAEKAPTLVTGGSADARMGADATREALMRIRERASSGTDVQSQLLQEEAQNSAAVANRGRQGAITESFANRGVGGSGMEMAAQLSNVQGANELAAQNSRAAARQAIEGRLQALRDQASIGGGMRQQELALEGKNVDLVNDFNQRTSMRQQDWANQTAATFNDASKFNTTNEQDVANRNTSTGNAFATQERNRQDANKQQGFTNEMSKAKAQGGITDMARSDIQANTRDTNAAIAGAGDGAQTALAYQQGKKKKEEEDPSNPLRRSY